MSKLKQMKNAIVDFIPPIHKEGYSFIFIFAAVTIILWTLWSPLGFLGLVLTVWCIAFFRDPNRIIPEGENLVVSPADGLIHKIEETNFPQELGLGDEKVWRVSVFLNVFNVHVNRLPMSGKVSALNYHPGQFLSADLDKASDVNERQSVVIDCQNGQKIVCVQIAGMIARRIVCDLEEEQQVNRGDRYGLIRFGSRVDIYLPKGIKPQVSVGQTAIGGETIIADFGNLEIDNEPEIEKIDSDNEGETPNNIINVNVDEQQ